MAFGGDGAKKIAAGAHVARMEDIEKVMRLKLAKGETGVESYLARDYYRTDAVINVLQSTTAPGTPSSRDALTLRLAAARLIYELEQNHEFRVALFWSRRWMEAAIAWVTQPSDRLAAAEAYLSRVKEIVQSVKDHKPDYQAWERDLYAATLSRVEAELLVSRMKGGADPGRAAAERAWVGAGKAAYEAQLKVYLNLGDRAESLYEYSAAWRAAATAIAKTKAERVAASEAHLARMSELAMLVKQKYEDRRMPAREFHATEYYKADAEVLLSKTKSNEEVDRIR